MASLHGLDAASPDAARANFERAMAAYGAAVARRVSLTSVVETNFLELDRPADHYGFSALDTYGGIPAPSREMLAVVDRELGRAGRLLCPLIAAACLHHDWVSALEAEGKGFGSTFAADEPLSSWWGISTGLPDFGPAVVRAVRRVALGSLNEAALDEAVRHMGSARVGDLLFEFVAATVHAFGVRDDDPVGSRLLERYFSGGERGFPRSIFDAVGVSRVLASFILDATRAYVGWSSAATLAHWAEWMRADKDLTLACIRWSTICWREAQRRLIPLPRVHWRHNRTEVLPASGFVDPALNCAAFDHYVECTQAWAQCDQTLDHSTIDDLRFPRQDDDRYYFTEDDRGNPFADGPATYLTAAASITGWLCATSGSSPEALVAYLYDLLLLEEAMQ